VSTIETLLANFARSGYLDKQKSTLIGSTGGASSSQAPGGRGRKRTADNDDGDGAVMEEFEWKWGSRAIAEINEAGVAAFVRDFMGARFGEREDEEAEGGGGAARRREAGAKSKGQEKVEKAVMNDLVRSAGGPLLEIQGRTHTVDDEQDGISEVGSEGG
jgi:melanoma-associated antigen